MSNNKQKMGLGKGLSTLLGDDEDIDNKNEKIVYLNIYNLQPSVLQPRHTFDEASLADLKQSIANKGVLQPLLVRKTAENSYEIIAGERRWRASQEVGLSEVPVIIKDFSDKETLEVALIENILREDLSPLEEAEGYKRLMEEFHNTQEELALTIGKSRSYIANTLRLLNLPDSVKNMLADKRLSAGHARTLLSSPNPEALAQKIVNEGLTVRATEKIQKQKKIQTPSAKKHCKSEDLKALEDELTNKLNVQVDMKLKGNKGEIVLKFKNLEQFDELLNTLVFAAKHKGISQ